MYGGLFQVCWKFILFENTLVHLVEFRTRGTKQNYDRKRLNTGVAKIGMGHLCLWAHEDIVPLQSMSQILKDGKDYPYAGFVTTKPVANEEARRQLGISDFYNDFGGGFRLVATRGPVGEKIEISYSIADRNKRNLKSFCDNKGVSTLMLRPLVKNNFQTKVSHRMSGFHHLGLTVKSQADTKKFYTGVLGGNRTQGSETPIKFFHDLLFQDDIFEAEASGVNPNLTFGVLPKLDRPLKVDFYYFSNLFFESYSFEDAIDGTETMMAPQYQSLAYHRSFVLGFHVNDSIDFNAYIKKVENDASSLGLSQVKAGRAVAVNTFGQAPPSDSGYSAPMTSEDLEGFNYVYMKGPSGEQLGFTQFKGAAKAALKEALLAYGGVSKAFRETDPWNYGGFTEYCTEQPQCECKNCECKPNPNGGNTASISYSLLMLFMLCSLLL